MANPATYDELKARALDYADMTDSPFPVADRVVDYINSAASDLYDILVNAYEDYFVTKATINISSASSEYDLPEDFYKALRVFHVNSDRRFPVPKFDLESISGSRTTPITAGTVELWYIPQMPLFTGDADEPEVLGVNIPPIVNGWEDYIALSAAIKLLIREESDTSALERQRGEVKGKIIGLAEPRDAGSPDRVQDRTERWRDWSYAFDPASFSLRYRVLGNNIEFYQYAVGY